MLTSASTLQCSEPKASASPQFMHLLLHFALNLECSNKNFKSNTNTPKTQNLHSESKQ